MSPSHEAGPGPLPALPAPSPARTHFSRPATTATRTDCSPHALRDRELFVRRVVAAPLDTVWSAVTDPWSLVTLLGGCTVLSVDDAPWRLEAGSVVEATVRRWGMTLSATITVADVRPGELLAWRVDFRRGGRTIHAGEFWTVELRTHPTGCVLTQSAERVPTLGSMVGLRERSVARVRTDMAVRLRELDSLVTRHDIPGTLGA